MFIHPKERPDVLSSKTVKVTLGCVDEITKEPMTMYVTTTFYEDGSVFEVFTTMGKAGGCEIANMEGLCRSISAGLRSGVDPQVYIKQLSGIRCPNPVMWGPEGKIKPLSCADGIAKVLKKVIGIEEPKRGHEESAEPNSTEENVHILPSIDDQMKEVDDMWDRAWDEAGKFIFMQRIFDWFFPWWVWKRERDDEDFDRVFPMAPKAMIPIKITVDKERLGCFSCGYKDECDRKPIESDEKGQCRNWVKFVEKKLREAISEPLIKDNMTEEIKINVVVEERPKDFIVICDESNNPPESVAEGKINATILIRKDKVPEGLRDRVSVPTVLSPVGEGVTAVEISTGELLVWRTRIYSRGFAEIFSWFFPWFFTRELSSLFEELGIADDLMSVREESND